jgi:hypothetical protein
MAGKPNQKPCGFLVFGVLRSKTPKTLEFHCVKLRKTKTAERFWFAQGIEAVSFFAVGKKDTSG